MTDPQTPTKQLSIPTRGSDVGTWDTPVNGDFSAIDGLFGGVQTISLSSSNVTLTSPAGSVTPGAGPTQVQNAVLRFTGNLSTNLVVTIPQPGFFIVDNQTTNFGVILSTGAGGGKVIGLPPGEVFDVFNDGTDMAFRNFGRVGQLTFLGGVTQAPFWIALSTVPPYLLCDGGVYSTSQFPALALRMGSSFGGNGSTSFGVPDLRGRVPLAYDGTGSRITVAGCGINGQTMGSSADNQSNTISQANLPSVTFSGNMTQQTYTRFAAGLDFNYANNAQAGGVGTIFGTQAIPSTQNTGGGTSISVSSGGSGTSITNVQPAQVSGVWLIKT